MSIPDKFMMIIPPQDIACAPGMLARLASGDREAYAWIYRNYCKKVYDYALLTTGNITLSEDIVQEVFIRLWLKREKLQLVSDFNAYLYMIYRNMVIDALKGQQRESSRKIRPGREAGIVVSDTDQGIICKELLVQIREAVKGLPKQQRLIFTLSKEYGWRREKMATRLQLSPNTVKGQLQKALRALRKKLNIS